MNKTEELLLLAVNEMHDAVAYDGDDDSIGRFPCCHQRTVDKHSSSCWVTVAVNHLLDNNVSVCCYVQSHVNVEFKAGDTAQLWPGVSSGEIPEGCEDNATARIEKVSDVRVVKFSEALRGLYYWDVDDLVKVGTKKI